MKTAVLMLVASFVFSTPSIVLIGTDTVPLKHAQIRKGCSDDSIAGLYRGEMGGAVISIVATKDSLLREFSEPGEAPQQKKYLSIQRNGCHWKGSGVEIYKVKGGLILWEANSQVDSISNSMWVQYFRRSDKKSSTSSKRLNQIEKQPKELPMLSYGKIHRLSQGTELQFADFTMVWQKQYDPEENELVKTTASIQIRVFRLQSASGDELQIKIHHGQLPPQPKEVEFAGKVFVVHTFKSPEGESLFPDKIYVERK